MSNFAPGIMFITNPTDEEQLADILRSARMENANRIVNLCEAGADGLLEINGKNLVSEYLTWYSCYEAKSLLRLWFILDEAKSNPKESALLEAVLERNIPAIKTLIADGANPNIALRGSVTPLYLAASDYQKDVMEALLEAGADPNARNRDGQTPLMKWVNKMLLDAGADVHARCNNGLTAMHYAAWRGHNFEQCKLLLEAGADINAPKTGAHAGWTPLMMAIAGQPYGFPYKVSYMLEDGASPNVEGCETTPLHVAVTENVAGLVEVLVLAGANLEARDANGDTPLDLARKLDRKSAVETLSDCKQIAPCKGLPQIYWTTELVEEICARDWKLKTKPETSVHRAWHAISRGADVNALVSDVLPEDALYCCKSSVLFLAVNGDRHDIVDMLLDAGADVTLEGRSNPIRSAVFRCMAYRTVPFQIRKMVYRLMMALECKMQERHAAGEATEQDVKDARLLREIASADINTEKVRLMLEEVNANPNSELPAAVRPLTLAAALGDVDVCKLLLEKGADVNAQDKYGDSAAMCARTAEVLNVLLEAGADLSVVNTRGWTPLMTATWAGNEELVKAILQRKSKNIDHKQHQGMSALHMAAGANNEWLVRVLLKHDADINIQDNAGRTPLYVAAHRGCSKAVDELLDAGADVSIKADAEKAEKLFPEAKTKYGQLLRYGRTWWQEDAIAGAKENRHDEIAAKLETAVAA